jgi:hypothetical protein
LINHVNVQKHDRNTLLPAIPFSVFPHDRLPRRQDFSVQNVFRTVTGGQRAARCALPLKPGTGALMKAGSMPD